MRWLILFLLLIGGGMKVAGAKLPVIDYPFGGLFFWPAATDPAVAPASSLS